MEKRQISCLIDKELLDKFQKLYPYMLSQFVRKAIKKACTNKTLFTQITFGED